ncbi:MAG: Fumarate hydratase [Thermocaproicibacter melissae]|jgi:fumarate hydratase subunit alpha|uniref:fumarate hydratase n=1 Tax=Thermocaproicibacter melissae TaxID=2966552 RepID=UPI0024B176EC|nr:fumarate hydratase [Thermocaproicibacter melissae]WBY63441.1 fumarate hydratase [Thermocaproicibacter melissae]
MSLREIRAEQITEEVKRLCIEANKELPEDLEQVIRAAEKTETSKIGKSILADLGANMDAARELNLPVCQDTGMAVVFADIGQDVHITGGAFEDAVNKGVRRGYLDGLLRLSVVADPIRRGNTGDNTPAVIHTRIVPGDRIALTVAPKGFGSENMSRLKMFTPAASQDDLIEFVAETVKLAGGRPCPPVVIGVGIGGDFELCALLAKKALCRPVSQRNADPFYAELEERMLRRVNELNVGPQGFGGSTTALAVNIEQYATHIAGLPIAVNMGCHVTRHKSVLI